MKMTQLFLAVLLFWAGTSRGAASENWKPIETNKEANNKPRKVLFIGNSYTYVNDLNSVLEKLAASAKPPVRLQTAALAKGGATLQNHDADPKTTNALSRIKWDLVVIQEQSMRPVVETAAFVKYARKLEERIVKQGAKPVFFMTWAREHKPEMTGQLDAAYTQMARELNAYVAPVGLAWAASLKANPEIKLYAKDQSHPTVYGTYLSACVFYATLTGQSPVGLSNAGLQEITAEHAKSLQETAWKTVQEYVKTHTQKPSKKEK